MSIKTPRKQSSSTSASRSPTLVTLPPARYLAVAGQGAPEGDAFQQATSALYAFAFTIKMSRKKAGRPTFTVSKLEGLWWVPGGEWLTAARDTWRWQVLIEVPSFVTAADLRAARKSLAERENPAASANVELTTLEEGECVQVMHVGPYSDEPRTIAAMDEFVRANQRRYRGKHHEIYLTDPRRSKPERMRTILRHPVA